jgi:hypothetical protein
VMPNPVGYYRAVSGFPGLTSHSANSKRPLCSAGGLKRSVICHLTNPRGTASLAGACLRARKSWYPQYIAITHGHGRGGLGGGSPRVA